MDRHWIQFGVAVAVVMAAAAATSVRGESWQLELKRRASDEQFRAGINTAEDFVGQQTNSQSFFMQIGGEEARIVAKTNQSESMVQSGQAAFAEVVKKEPPQYESAHPFRGVAKLGSQRYGFVLDAAPGQKKEEKKGETQGPAAKPERKPLGGIERYGRLYFDVNHNGDLTDDRIIEAEPRLLMFGRVNTMSSFPVVDITLDVDGTAIPYAFSFSVYTYGDEQNQYVTAQLNAAAYRRGEITLNGKKLLVVLVDHNSNGRFDDRMGVDDNMRVADGTLYPRSGDVIYVGLGSSVQGLENLYDATRNDVQHYVSKWIPIEGRYYDLQISPAGDKLTLEPSSAAVGYVTNPNQGYRALVYSDQGFLKIRGDDSGRAPLPAGSWKLAACSIDRTEPASAAKPSDSPPSLLQSLSELFTRRVVSSGPRITLVSARAKADYPAVQVRAGETVSMAFGPPYTPKVDVSYRQGTDRVYLGMSLVGSAGEVCNNLMVDGGRPTAPRFTITAPDGKEVEKGIFEYG